MQKCEGQSFDPIILDNNGSDNLKEIITINNEEFINYIHRLGLQLEHKDETRNYISRSTTILTLKTRCFKVDFNDNFVKISPLK